MKLKIDKILDEEREADVWADTKANILSSSGQAGQIALATDTKRFFIHDGTNWNESATELTARTASENIGALENESSLGYGSDYITDKVLSYCKLGGSADDEEGSVRQVNGIFQIYLNGVWNDVVINFVFREDSTTGSYELEHQPVGLTKYYEVASGNSNELGIDGKPLFLQYGGDIGAHNHDLLISGGEF